MKTARASDKFLLRLPPGMREFIKQQAAENGRSMNAEIINRLKESKILDPQLKNLNKRITALESRR